MESPVKLHLVRKDKMAEIDQETVWNQNAETPKKVHALKGKSESGQELVGSIAFDNLKKSPSSASKNFMAQTISAASKANTTKKRVLVDKNDDSNSQRTPVPRPKSTSRDRFDEKVLDDVTSIPRGSLESSIPRAKFLRYNPKRRQGVLSKKEAEDEELKRQSDGNCYDPVNNYLSPRPKYLWYDPIKSQNRLKRNAICHDEDSDCSSISMNSHFDDKENDDFDTSNMKSENDGNDTERASKVMGTVKKSDDSYQDVNECKMVDDAVKAKDSLSSEVVNNCATEVEESEVRSESSNNLETAETEVEFDDKEDDSGWGLRRIIKVLVILFALLLFSSFSFNDSSNPHNNEDLVDFERVLAHHEALNMSFCIKGEIFDEVEDLRTFDDGEDAVLDAGNLDVYEDDASECSLKEEDAKLEDGEVTLAIGEVHDLFGSSVIRISSDSASDGPQDFDNLESSDLHELTAGEAEAISEFQTEDHEMEDNVISELDEMEDETEAIDDVKRVGDGTEAISDLEETEDGIAIAQQDSAAPLAGEDERSDVAVGKFETNTMKIWAPTITGAIGCLILATVTSRRRRLEKTGAGSSRRDSGLLAEIEVGEMKNISKATASAITNADTERSGKAGTKKKRVGTPTPTPVRRSSRVRSGGADDSIDTPSEAPSVRRSTRLQQSRGIVSPS